jgi:hypothetical protein
LPAQCTIQTEVNAAEIASTIEEFIASCTQPALLEQGEPPLPLRPAQFQVHLSPRGAVLEAWDESRTWARRILKVSPPQRKQLHLEAFRLGKKTAQVTLVDVGDARSQAALEKSSRGAFAQQFRMFLQRRYGGWRLESFRSEPNLQYSFSPVFPTAFYTRGQQALAALAAPPRDTSFHSLSFALVWLDYLRQQHGAIAGSKLLLYLPERHHRSPALLARHLHHVKVEIWLYTEDGGEYPLDGSDVGNVESALPARYSRLAGPAWWLEFLAAHPEVDTIEEADGRLSYRLRGLEFARLRPPSFDKQPLLSYGVPRHTKASRERLSDVESLLAELQHLRHAGAENTNNPIYTAEPERWLESQVRRNLDRLHPALLPELVYGQVLGSLSGERSALDLLAITRQQQLVILELKASEDIHLPLQGFDYWLRMCHHLHHNHFAHNGYFPGTMISPVPPQLMLVSPALHWHPTTDAILRYLPAACQTTLIGLNGKWRENLDVVMTLHQ